MTDKLKAAAEMALETADGIANSNWRNWQELSSPEEFERWVKARANHMAITLRQALDQLPDTTKMIERTSMSASELADRIKRGEKWQPLDTGTDRGAWADVPDATKWVDELRGDDEELPPVKSYCGGKPNYCQPEEPPNSTTDVVEPVAYVHLNEWLDDKLWPEDAFGSHPYEGMTPLYTAPPKREWQGLTDEEIRDIHWSKPMDEYSFARAIEAKLKEKNT